MGVLTRRCGRPYLPAVDTASNISAHGAAPRDRTSELDSPAAWRRLAVATLLGTVGSVGMWSVPVALPAVQADFAVARADASLPYTLAMVGFALGGVLMGWLSDRRGVVAPLLCGVAALSLGFIAAGLAGTLMLFALAHGLLIGIGASASFGPLIADTSQWFARRRGIAVAVVSCGNYRRRHLAAAAAAFHLHARMARHAIGVGVFARWPCCRSSGAAAPDA
jgi:MFS family permease